MTTTATTPLIDLYVARCTATGGYYSANPRHPGLPYWDATIDKAERLDSAKAAAVRYTFQNVELVPAPANRDQNYWGHSGRYQRTGDELHKLIPDEGAVPQARSKNKALDKYRRACNCYYDLFNNGLCNRASEFRSVFGIPAGTLPIRYSIHGHKSFDWENDSLYRRVDEAMDRIIIDAAAEQHIALMGAQSPAASALDSASL